MEATSKRMTLVDKDNYKVDLEYNEDFAILHLPQVNKMTRDTYADMKSQLVDILDFVMTMGYSSLWAGMEPSNAVTIKFAKKMGFEYQGTAQGYDIYQLERIN